jgi:hypothetical protein
MIITETTLEFIYVDCKPTAEPDLEQLYIVQAALDKASEQRY